MERRRYSRIRAVASPPIPPASGIECVRTLVALGWVPLAWTDRECQLEKGHFALTVPLDAELSSTRLAAIVDLAVEVPLAFVAALERVRTRRMTTVYALDDESSDKAG